MSFAALIRAQADSKIAFAGTSGWHETEIQPVTARQRERVAIYRAV
jgi:hypothetical protein